MKRSVLKRCFAIITVLFVMCFSTISYAHPGRTDKNGGHKDNQNKSGLGSYHYHCGDYDAHLHPNGYCPYSSSGRSSTTISSKKTTEVSEPVAAIVEEKPIEKKIVEAEKPVQKIVEKDIATKTNEEQSTSESDNSDSSGGFGTVLLLGGAGYLAYKKISG